MVRSLVTRQDLWTTGNRCAWLAVWSATNINMQTVVIGSPAHGDTGDLWHQASYSRVRVHLTRPYATADTVYLSRHSILLVNARPLPPYVSISQRSCQAAALRGAPLQDPSATHGACPVTSCRFSVSFLLTAWSVTGNCRHA